MYSTVSVWRLLSADLSSDETEAQLREMTLSAIKVARPLGILDIIMVQDEPDRFHVISSYESEETANASGPPLLAHLHEHFGNRIELISRTVGRAYEPSQFTPLESTEALDWREDADAMYANLNIYKVHESIREPAAFEQFLAEMAKPFLTVLEQLGLLDMLVVRTGTETLVVVRLFENPDAFDRAMALALERFPPDRFNGKIELIHNIRGRAFDAINLLSR